MRTMEESIEQKAQERADRKLQYIIGRYGDANGERRKPYYREQLIQEAKAALSWEIFSLAFQRKCPGDTDQSVRGMKPAVIK